MKEDDDHHDNNNDDDVNGNDLEDTPKYFLCLLRECKKYI